MNQRGHRRVGKQVVGAERKAWGMWGGEGQKSDEACVVVQVCNHPLSVCGFRVSGFRFRV